MTDRTDAVVVIGAGAAGLGTAGALHRRGVRATVIEASTEIGTSWRSRHHALRLNTPGWLSGLPGRRASIRKYGEFPTRDDWIRYLEEYAGYGGFPIDFGVTVRRVDRAPDGWRLSTSDGERIADTVVVATGSDRVPHLPEWPNRPDFKATLLHAAEFTDSAVHRGQDVLVVGPNVSGVEIATLLAQDGAARVRIAVRTPPNLITRKRFGVSVNVTGFALQRCPSRFVDELTWRLWRPRFGPLARHGLPRAPYGVATGLREHRIAPAYDEGFAAAIRAGRIEVVPAVTDLHADGVTLADGTVIAPEVVIAATGYRRDLEPLVGHLGVLDEQGFPRINGPEQDPDAPGLYFNGFRGDLTGMLRPMRVAARGIARDVTGPRGHPIRWRTRARHPLRLHG